MTQVMHRCTVVAVFEEPGLADRAVAELHAAGFHPEEVGRLGGPHEDGPCGCVTDWADPPEGHAAVAVYAPDRYSEALAILQQFGALDIDRVEDEHAEVGGDYYLG